MSFTIKCNNCGNELIVENNQFYPTTDTIDLYAESDIENPTTLDFFCKNPNCNHEIQIII